jgi:indolepyruvate ferredoxin oxidoreductase beta subunit
MTARPLPPPGTRLILAGLGGQGVVSASRLIAGAALRLGWPVIGAESHGMSQRGGSVLSHLKLGAADSPLIGRGTADLMLAFERNEAVRSLPYLRNGGACVVNAQDGLGYGLETVLSEARIAVHSLPATAIALEHGAAALVNIILIGFARALGCLPVPEEALRAAVAELSRAQGERNVRAFAAGMQAASLAVSHARL